MTRQQYHEYLRSNEWAGRRRAVLSRDEYRCASCDAREGLNVHHLTYDRLGREPLRDLLTLCQGCHERLHDLVDDGDAAIGNPIGGLFKTKPTASGPLSAPPRSTYLHEEARQRTIRESQERARLELSRQETPEERESAERLVAALGFGVV